VRSVLQEGAQIDLPNPSPSLEELEDMFGGPSLEDLYEI
jgi:hypothetical protein